jgi:hypothetical protein
MAERAALLRSSSAASTTDDLLRELVVEVRGLRADLRRKRDEPALIAALDAEFGSAPFTVAGLVSIALEDPCGELAAALEACIDMNACDRARATQLGMLLSRLEGVDTVDRQKNVSVFRLRP